MKRALLFCLLLAAVRDVFGACPAGVCTAASASLADVSAQVALAVDGDVVNVPAGAATWTNISLGSKAITLIGAGPASTIITNAAGNLIRSNNTGNNLVRISGFRFNNSNNQTPIIAFGGPSFKVRVDNCLFSKGDAAVGTNDAFGGIKGTGAVWGVVDHCTFLNMKRNIFAMDVRVGETIDVNPNVPGGYGSTSWLEGIHPGTEQMMYYEDCQFQRTEIVPSGQGMLYGDYGGRVCVRNSTATGMSYQIDAHGDPTDNAWGTVFYELYNNTFTETCAFSGPDLGHPSCQGVLLWQRGGQWIVHDNTFNTVGGGVHKMSVYYTVDSVAQRVKNTYVWANTVNGTPNTIISYVQDSGAGCSPCNANICGGTGQTCGGYSAANIRLGTEYFNAQPTSGQAYYPYSTYTYPHPLISGATPTPTPTPTPGAPVILTQPFNIEINVGQVATFSIVIASGGGSTTYVWKKDGVTVRTSPPTGATSDAYNGPNGSPPVTLADNGSGYLCIATNAAGSTTSNTAILTVLPVPCGSLTCEAIDGLIESPFVISGLTILQNVQTIDPAFGGKGTWQFTIPNPANATGYTMACKVDCPDGASNSFFVAEGADPTAAMVWNVPVTSGLESRAVMFTGETAPHVFMLATGTSKVIFRGREAGAKLGDITFTPVADPSPTPTPTPTPPAAPPVLTPNGGGPFITSQDVTVTSATTGATFKYTLTGEDLATAPTPSILTYTTPIPVDHSLTIKAVADAAGFVTSSQTTSKPYEIKVATPTVTPNGGAFTGMSTPITLATTTPGCSLYYTLDGTTPTVLSTPYGVPFVVNATTTVKVIARKIGLTSSDIASATFTITAPSPTPTPTPTATPTPTVTPTPGPVSNLQWLE